MLLYPRDSHLSDVPPDFHGQPYKQWLRDEQDANFARRRDTPNGAPGTKWRNKAIWTKRDSYGVKSL